MGNIRKCTWQDTGWVTAIAEQFNNKLFDVPFNYDRGCEYIDRMIWNPDGVCFRGDYGAIIGVVAPDPFRDWTVLVEIGWYTEKPGEGLQLLDRFIDEGRSRGVNEIRMTTLERNKSVAKLLERKGFVPIETSHRLLL